MITVGAFYFFSSGGNPKRYETGKQYMIAALTGALLTTLAYALLRLLGVQNI
jgi:hypothetical protein